MGPPVAFTVPWKIKYIFHISVWWPVKKNSYTSHLMPLLLIVNHRFTDKRVWWGLVFDGVVEIAQSLQTGCTRNYLVTGLALKYWCGVGAEVHRFVFLFFFLKHYGVFTALFASLKDVINNTNRVSSACLGSVRTSVRASSHSCNKTFPSSKLLHLLSPISAIYMLYIT